MLSSACLRLARSRAPSVALNRLAGLPSLTVGGTVGRRTLAAAAAHAPPASILTPIPDISPASVYDKIIKITIIDPSGARRSIPALVGQSLYTACTMNNIDLGPASVGAPQQRINSSTWTEPLYGEGATSGFDHVILQSDNIGVMAAEPPHSNEIAMLEAYWDEDELVEGSSRLASMVMINNDMDGMVVYVPDRLCDDIP
ncbi:hypothetical protein ACHAXH_009886 [Discostella pseudostelligera]|jgi:hypothetical protein